MSFWRRGARIFAVDADGRNLRLPCEVSGFDCGSHFGDGVVDAWCLCDWCRWGAFVTANRYWNQPWRACDRPDFVSFADGFRTAEPSCPGWTAKRPSDLTSDSSNSHSRQTIAIVAKQWGYLKHLPHLRVLYSSVISFAWALQHFGLIARWSPLTFVIGPGQHATASFALAH